MCKTKFFGLIRFTAVLLALVLMLPTGVMASSTEEVQPRASDYLDTYSASVYSAGNGNMQVWYSVTGTRTMDSLGTLSISVYESTDNKRFSLVTTFSNETTPSMVGYNHYYHSGHVDFQGVVGKYYKAYVCVWAGKDGGGDTRYFYTTSRLAT